MADTGIGKSVYEGEKDIEAQKQAYAAFLQLMGELIKLIPGLNLINIQKGQGLTIERKPPGQVIEDIVEVEQKPTPEAIQAEPAKKPGIETLYGGGQNNLTANDIKAISAIIAGKRGDTVIGGENLIIKYNGKTLFETDDRGKISLHTAVSPQIRERFAALQAGQTTPVPAPTNAPNNETVVTPKPQETVAQSLPVVGIQTIPEEKPETTINAGVTPQPVNNVLPPSNQESVSEEPDFTDPKVLIEVEKKDIGQQIEQPLTESVHVINHDDIPTSELLADGVVEEQIVDVAGESPSGVEQVEPTEPVVVSKKSIVENVGNYVLDRGKRDSQVTANAVSQMASKFGTIFLANLAQGFQAIPEQYSFVKARLANNVRPEDDPKLEASINRFMDQVGDGFDEIQRDDHNVVISANHTEDELKPVVDYPGFINRLIEPVTEIVGEPEQVTQSPESITNDVTVGVVDSQSPDAPKPSKLQAVSIEEALRYMQTRDDGGKARDGKGYNLDDTDIGKKLSAQIDNGEPLDRVQAKDALAMLEKYHRQFAEGGIKIPATWKSVQANYSEPVDQAAIFTRQQAKLDSTQTHEQQQSVLKAVHTMFFRNLTEEQGKTMGQAGTTEILLPTGAKLISELDAQGIESILLQKDQERILLGGISFDGNYSYTPVASGIAQVMPELRQLKPFLDKDLRLSSEPINAIPLTQPLPANKKDTSKSVDAEAEKKPFTITPTKTGPRIIPERMSTPEPDKKPAMLRGGR